MQRAPMGEGMGTSQILCCSMFCFTHSPGFSSSHIQLCCLCPHSCTPVLPQSGSNSTRSFNIVVYTAEIEQISFEHHCIVSFVCEHTPICISQFNQLTGPVLVSQMIHDVWICMSYKQESKIELLNHRRVHLLTTKISQMPNSTKIFTSIQKEV